MIATALMSTVLCGGVVGFLPPAEKLQVTTTISAGSGVSVAGSGQTGVAKRSPVVLLGEIGFAHPKLPWVEFSPAIQLEVEGRMSFGIVPKLRLMLPPLLRDRRSPRRLRAFGVIGVPLVLVPFTLVGAQIGAGVELLLHDRVGVMAEATGSAYLLGSDLMEGSALGKFDLVGGVRAHF